MGMLVKRCAKWMRRRSFKCYQYFQKCAIGDDGKGKLSHIRNIGVLAHIDAGKTTTTERMLFYSGKIRSMGEVHRGNTVTDYMDQERLRGITISSVAVSFEWNNHQFNLVDTPGHIDFTIEVERTLNILDGAVVILDGSAGVEAQTSTVWRQADRYNLPRIVYINKMDRNDASLTLCLESLESKMEVRPFPVQLPIYNREKKLCGLIDLLTLERLTWDVGTQGRAYSKTTIDPKINSDLQQKALSARIHLTEQLADEDDMLAEFIIQQESLEAVPAEILTQSLRRITLSQKGVPVLCGSSYKNLGVQPLLDAVIHYLPAPDERNQQLILGFQDALCARAFKIIHDNLKHPVTFFRIYSGKFIAGQKIYNIHQNKVDHIGRLMIAYANENVEVEEVNSGNIAAITGLKHTVTGDLVTTNANSAAAARKRLESDNSKGNDVFGLNANVPVPVFFCSIEPPSQAYQQALDKALQALQREDPSLVVTQNVDTGQTVLGGMGELHLEIIKNRIQSEYKIDVYLGPLQIAYRERIKNDAKDTYKLEHKIGSTQHSVEITLSLLSKTDVKDSNIVVLDRNPESASNLASISPKYFQAIKQGIEAALSHGPVLHCPVIDVIVMLHWFEVARGTSETVVSAATTQCINKILSTNGTHLLEPVMQLEIVTCADNLSPVLADLSRRRSIIHEINSRGRSRVVHAMTPLSELLGYSTDLRTLTSGTSSFTMEFHSYQAMLPHDEAKAIKSIVGF